MKVEVARAAGVVGALARGAPGQAAVGESDSPRPHTLGLKVLTILSSLNVSIKSLRPLLMLHIDYTLMLTP